ncbi:zinc carboxypeptidase-like [Battus philenor]|uniref:zinc carboxypeptidase-like n=1 Tax=Battus philenor TaxID=42288 RepID=UPI0035CEB03C
MRLNIILLVSYYVFTVNAYKSYTNYKVYDVVASNEVQVQILQDLKKDGYDYWTDVFGVGNNVRIMVPPSRQVEFVDYCKTVGLDPVVSINDVQKLIEDQLKSHEQSDRSNTLGSFSWSRYHTLAEIHAWLDELATTYPNVVTTVRMGISLEGEPIKGVIIDFKPGERGDSPLIAMIEGGIHSREWISPATVTWIIKEFLTSNDADLRHLAEAFVWHIFPVVNPDGYNYTFTSDRMWRKNRNTANYRNCTNNSNDLSNGIDLNRNFNFLWMTTGASSDPCTQIFAGPSAGSEQETQAISNYVLTLNQTGNLLYYFAFHSYSQMILVPYSHASGSAVLEAENYADMYEIAIRGADKLTSRHGTPYTVGTSADILYEVSGSSFDWVKGVANVPIVYLFELRDVGEYGFLLPPEQIVPNNEEIMDCLLEIDRTTREIGYYSGANALFSSLVILLISTAFIILN